MTHRRTRPFSELSKDVRARPGASEEIDARKGFILSAVRLVGLRQYPTKTQGR